MGQLHKYVRNATLTTLNDGNPKLRDSRIFIIRVYAHIR
jgi:hypothetical protein